MSGMVVLISGRGSNLRAVLESACAPHVCAVISDNADAPGLDIARQYGKPAHVCAGETRDDFDAALTRLIAPYRPRLVALAGFMRVLGGDFVRAHRVVNIHPSLLPQFRGLNTHARALAAGAAEHGCSVHWVNDKIDGGEVIAQRRVAVCADDDGETLAARVLAEEHRLYPRVLLELLNAAD